MAKNTSTRKDAAPAVELVPVDRLAPYAGNARTHDAAQVAQIAASVREFGWTNPLLIDEAGRIIAGHGRLDAARLLDMAAVPCIRLVGLTEPQKRALTIADNRLAENAGWNPETLQLEMAALQLDGFDTTLTGFDDAALDRLLGIRKAGRTDPDDAPEPQAAAVSMIGDVWILGAHRLACGDSTASSDVSAALAGARPHLMVTDPPYGVKYDPDWRNRVDRANGKPYGARAVGLVTNDDRADWQKAYDLFPGAVAYVWHQAGARQVDFFNSLRAAGFDIRTQIIWVKSHFPIGRGHYHVQHEACFYAVRKGETGHWQGDRKQSTVWQIDKPMKSETGHSTQKPVECMRRPIVNNSVPGDAVYEPFSGSGTTIIACEMEGRACYAIELSPIYVDMAVRRWEAFTGGTAVLAADGSTFADVAAARIPVAA